MNLVSSHSTHIVPYRTLLIILLCLLALTGLTVAVAQYDLGGLNILAALFIASLKASLVLMFFMHMRYENRIIFSTFIITLCILAIFISFMFWDVAFR